MWIVWRACAFSLEFPGARSFTLLYIALSLQPFVYTPGGLANITLFCDPGVLLLCPPRQNCNSNGPTVPWTQRTQPPLSSTSSLERLEQMLQLIIIIIIIPQLATLTQCLAQHIPLVSPAASPPSVSPQLPAPELPAPSLPAPAEPPERSLPAPEPFSGELHKFAGFLTQVTIPI